jgi:hypothetical protein
MESEFDELNYLFWEAISNGEIQEYKPENDLPFNDYEWDQDDLPFDDDRDEGYGSNVIPPWIWFESKEKIQPVFDFHWNVPFLTTIQIEKAFENLKKVYSKTAIEIASLMYKPSEFKSFIHLLVNIAGFRSHYNEDWMAKIIPTRLMVSSFFTKQQMKMSDDLLFLFEHYPDFHGLGDYWKEKTGIIPDDNWIKRLCEDSFWYGKELVERAILVCTGDRVKNGKENIFEIYTDWLEHALNRDWLSLQEVIKKAGIKESEGMWGIPGAKPDLVRYFFEFKFGEGNVSKIMDRIYHFPDIKRLLSAAGIQSKETLDFEKLVVTYYLLHDNCSFENYLLNYEDVTYSCDDCGKHFTQLDDFYLKDYAHCPFCDGDLENHRVRLDWEKVEKKYEIFIYSQDEFELSECCLRCHTHFKMRSL